MAEKLKEQNAYGDGVFITHRRASAPATRTEAPPPAHYGGAYADDEDEDALYNQRPPSSARKYRQQPEVYTRGNQKIIVHRETPKGRRFHWMIFMGMVMFVMVLGWLLFTAVGYWWQGKQDDFKYGTPRTFQEDMFVGHGDSPDHPDHFIGEWDLHLRPIRNMLSRVRSKLRSIGIEVLNIHEVGYMLQAVRKRSKK